MLPYKRLKKLLKKSEAEGSPGVFLGSLETICDELESNWRQRARECLSSSARRVVSFSKSSEVRVAHAQASAAELGAWAALNALGLRKIVKKLDKAGRRRRDAGDVSWSGHSGSEWVQSVALGRLSFLQSALRVEVFALATLASLARPKAHDAGASARPGRCCTTDSESGDDVGNGAASEAGESRTRGAAPAAAFGQFDAALSCASYVSDFTSCQVCLEVMVQPVGFASCGHPVCRPCFNRMVAVEATAGGGGGGGSPPAVRCPTCRAADDYVELVQLERLARELQPLEYRHRAAELRSAKYLARVRGAKAAARSLFPSHGDLIAAAGFHDGGTGPPPARVARPRVATAPHQLARFAPRPFPIEGAAAATFPSTAPFSAALLEGLGV
jgi:hypothetical protein